MTKDIKEGTRIWRIVTQNKWKEPIPEDYIFKETPSQDFYFRAIQDPNFKTKDPYEWLVSKNSKQGILCICKSAIPTNWICFEVTEISECGALVIPVFGSAIGLLNKYVY
jgi:hypothetical protein